MVCRLELVKHCVEGCRDGSYSACVEDIPPPPPPPPPPPVLATLGTPCESDADCNPAGRINTPEGPRQLVLHCNAMRQCEDEVYEHCNGVDDDADLEVDEGCSLAATMQAVAITGRPLSVVVQQERGFAITTDDRVFHFLDESLVEVAAHTPRDAATLIATRDGFAFAETYALPGGTATDVLRFTRDGAPDARFTITPGQRGSRMVEVRDGVAWLLTLDGLLAFDAASGAPLPIPAIPTDLSVGTPAFSFGPDVVLCLATQMTWVAPDGSLTVVDEPCAARMARSADVLWGFDGSIRRYPRTSSIVVAALAASAMSPSFGAPRGIAFTATNTRALVAVAYPEASFVTLTEVGLDGTSQGYSAPIASDDELIGGVQRGESTLLFLHSPTMGTRALRFAPR
jgi:hypothetical protein